MVATKRDRESWKMEGQNLDLLYPFAFHSLQTHPLVSQRRGYKHHNCYSVMEYMIPIEIRVTLRWSARLPNYACF